MRVPLPAAGITILFIINLKNELLFLNCLKVKFI
jgi:hypothetical protein